MTTLVTGIGLVGTAFARCALSRGEPVAFVDSSARPDYLRRRLHIGAASPAGDAPPVATVVADVRDLASLEAAMRDHRTETVIHTAGLIAGRVSEPLYTGLEVNVTGTVNVMEAVRRCGVRRVVLVSSFAVYDRRRLRPGSGPLGEDSPRGPGRAYGNSKVIKELVAESYQVDFGFELVILRPANAYGYGHFAGGSGGAKIQNLLTAGLTGGVARVASQHTMDFEYVYDLDVGRAVDLAAITPMTKMPLQPRSEGCRVFNIGTGVITTFADLVATARSILPDLDVEVVGSRAPAVSAGDPLDLSAAASGLGWRPEFDLESGLRHYCEEIRRLGADVAG